MEMEKNRTNNNGFCLSLKACWIELNKVSGLDTDTRENKRLPCTIFPVCAYPIHSHCPDKFEVSGWDTDAHKYKTTCACVQSTHLTQFNSNIAKSPKSVESQVPAWIQHAGLADYSATINFPCIHHHCSLTRSTIHQTRPQQNKAIQLNLCTPSFFSNA